MKIIVGLGNPGKEYINTRHNVGYFIIDNFVGEEKWKEKFQALYCEKNINGEKIIFVKPLTYMNLSGNAVRQFMSFYNVDIEDLFVIQDDLDLVFGTYKLKKNSSAGGHNGIKSIIQSVGSNEFPRLKVGISNDKSMDTKDYVLGRLSKKELEELSNLQSTFNKIINCYIKEGIDRTMNIYNTKK